MAISTAILVFDDVQIIDYTGPFEALGRRGPTYLVAQKGDFLTTNMGMQVVPNYSFRQEPKPDVLVIPGGGSSGEAGTRLEPGSGADDRARLRVTVEVVRLSSAQ